MFQLISEKKNGVSKILFGVLETFLHDHVRNNDSYKIASMPLLSFHVAKKQQSNFQQVIGLVTKNIQSNLSKADPCSS